MVKEKYLPLEEPVREPEPEKTPKEKRKEKWDNFWFYYKKPFWIILVSLVVILYIWDPFHPAPKPDYSLGIISGKYWSAELQTKLSKALAPYGEDLNGDGQVLVDVTYYLMSEDASSVDPQEMQAYYVKLMGDLETGTTMLFLCDDINMSYFGIENGLFCQLSDFSGINAGDSSIKVDQIGLGWQTVDGIGQNAAFSKSATKMYFGIRSLTGTAAKHETQYNQAKALMERLIANKPVDAQQLEQVLAEAQADAVAKASSGTASATGSSAASGSASSAASAAAK